MAVVVGSSWSLCLWWYGVRGRTTGDGWGEMSRAELASNHAWGEEGRGRAELSAIKDVEAE